MDQAPFSAVPKIQMNKEFLIGAVVAVLVVVLGFLAFWFRTPMGAYFSGTAAQQKALSGALTDFNTNNFDQALQASGQVLASDPNNIQALLLKAITLAQEGSLQFKEQEYGVQAEAVARQALALDPKNSEAWRIIGYSEEIRQNYDAAHQAYTQATALDPKNALAIADDAHAYDLQGNIVKAEAGYMQALKINPNLDLANLGLVRILIREQDQQAALPILDRVIAATPNIRYRAEADYMAGSIEINLHDHAQARSFLEQATATDPSFPLGWFGLSRELFAEAADVSTSTTLSNDQRNALAKESLQDLIKAVTLNPNQSIAYMQMGIELIYVGQTDNGIKALKNAEQIMPQDITLNAIDKHALSGQLTSFLKLFGTT